ncbi:hypothetical protein SANA_27760 [Gottschalkiaceae bacterium SANA]|nr:hypothetical protein SANA_27760 [Gottschalkiaceae bacterium SANA]
MKKISIVLLITTLLFASFTPGFAAMERATLPDSPVTFNGTPIDNQRATYPLIVYKNITYFPMTWDYASALGLSSNYTEARGLVIEKSNSSVNLVQSVTANNNPNASYAVSLPYFPITVNGKKINNAKEPYPLLLFRNITYFPLTWAFAVTEFGWEYSYNNVIGLKIETHPFQPTSPLHEQKTINYGNGDVYKGEMLNTYKDGTGTFTWANGDYYSGEWAMNKKEGTGILMRSNGNSYSGEWRNDDKNGFGTFSFSNSDRYQGEVTQSRYHGIGTFTWANGNQYQGTWIHSKRTGHGIMTYANGDQYEGDFLDDLYDGYGKTTLANGTVKEGIWKAGKLDKSLPAPPTNISVEATTDKTIGIHWTPAENVNYATLYYTTDPAGKWVEMKHADGLTLKLRGTGYTFGQALPGQVYYFKLTSTYSGNESTDSIIVSIQANGGPKSMTTHVIQSQIKQVFEGFKSERSFELANGQVWKQTSFENENSHLFKPDVLIYLDDNEYKMIVEGLDQEITVIRVK